MSLVAAAAAGRPLAARADQPKLFRIGYLDAGTAADPAVKSLRQQFMRGLRDLGDVEGRDFQMLDRNAGGDLARLPELALDLVRTPVDIIVAAGGEAPVRAAMQTTNRIPIVITVSADPVGSGLVASLDRPGGNVTGMSSLATEMAGKRLELLKEIVPRAIRVAVLWNPDNASKAEEWRELQTAAQAKAVTLISVEARSPEQIDPAFNSISHDRPDAMIVLTEGLTLANRARIGQFALANKLPTVAELREFAVVGAIASYGVSRSDLWRRAAGYVDKIMHGAKAADLPVEQPVKFEMVISVKTARAIGVAVPPTLLARADEVIE